MERKGLFTLLGLCAIASSRATMIDFELLSSGSNPGNIYAGSGVNFTRGNLSGASFGVGDLVTWSQTGTDISGFSDPATAWSGNMVGYAPGTEDLMMDFDTAMSSISLLTDRFPNDPADVVRLMALTATANPGEYSIVAVVSANDDGVSLIDNTMSLSGLNNTKFVFQATTEQEGIDNLSFQPVPEPASMTALGVGIAALLRRRKK